MVKFKLLKPLDSSQSFAIAAIFPSGKPVYLRNTLSFNAPKGTTGYANTGSDGYSHITSLECPDVEFDRSFKIHQQSTQPKAAPEPIQPIRKRRIIL